MSLVFLFYFIFIVSVFCKSRRISQYIF